MMRFHPILFLTTALLAVGVQASAQTGASTWTDSQTGLTWTRQDNGSRITWNDAVAYCRSLSLAGHSDWRLPTIDEIAAVFDGSASAHAQDFDIKMSGMNYVKKSVHLIWSSTLAPPADDGSSKAWVILMDMDGSKGKRGSFAIKDPSSAALCVSGKPPQPAQGPTLEQTVTWLKAKLSADAVTNIELAPNGMMTDYDSKDGYFTLDLGRARTIGQEDCEEHSKDGTKTYPCIHLTGGPWYRFIQSESFARTNKTELYLWFRPGTDMGPVLKAFKRLAVLQGATIVDDDLFK